MSAFALIKNDGEHTFSRTDAELLRKYKKFLQAHRMKESLWCVKCEERGDPAGLRASVMDDKIDFLCRCTARRYRGQTF